MSVLTKEQAKHMRDRAIAHGDIDLEAVCDSHEAMRARVETLENALRRACDLLDSENIATPEWDALLSGEPKGGGANPPGYDDYQFQDDDGHEEDNPDARYDGSGGRES